MNSLDARKASGETRVGWDRILAECVFSHAGFMRFLDLILSRANLKMMLNYE